MASVKNDTTKIICWVIIEYVGCSLSEHKSEIKANNAVGDGRMTSYSSCIMLNYNDNEQNWKLNWPTFSETSTQFEFKKFRILEYLIILREV